MAFEINQDGGGRHLGFVRTVNSAVRSAIPENPTLEPNMALLILHGTWGLPAIIPATLKLQTVFIF